MTTTRHVHGDTRSMYPGNDPENGPRCRHTYRADIDAWLDPYADREYLEARRCGPHIPFNLALHAHMIALGYAWHRIPDTFEDDGDGESGPHLIGGPACDQYTGPDEYVYCAYDGLVLDRQPRDPADLEWERHCRAEEAMSKPVHKSAFECGASDAYYGRTAYGPRYWVKGDTCNEEVKADAMTDDQIAEYHEGVASEHDQKDWGVQ